MGNNSSTHLKRQPLEDLRSSTFHVILFILISNDCGWRRHHWILVHPCHAQIIIITIARETDIFGSLGYWVIVIVLDFIIAIFLVVLAFRSARSRCSGGTWLCLPCWATVTTSDQVAGVSCRSWRHCGSWRWFYICNELFRSVKFMECGCCKQCNEFFDRLAIFETTLWKLQVSNAVTG